MSDSPPPFATVETILAQQTVLARQAMPERGPVAGANPSAPALSHPLGVAAALAERLRRDPSTPAVTFYDDATGERVELSTATLDNWVAKTANLLVDTLGVAPGDRISVDLPPHWTTVAVLLAAWSAGAEVWLATDPDTGSQASGLSVAFVAADRVDAALASDADEVVALSLRPLGGRLSHPIAGVLDFAAEVPTHGDRFAAPPPPDEQGDLLRVASVAARAWGLGPGDRVLSTAQRVDSTEGLLGTLLGPLVAGASVVICRRPEPSLLARRVAAERVTAVCGPVQAELPAGVRRLATLR